MPGGACARAALVLSPRPRSWSGADLALVRELRNPLSVARNGLALLRRGNAQAPSDHPAPLVEQQFGHMERLIEDLLDTSQLCRGQLSLRRERLPVRAVAQAAADAARGLPDSKDLALEVGLPDGALQGDADPTRLAQALGNVIANAIKYTPAPGTVRIEADRDDEGDESDEHAGWVRLRISDTGLGMSAATLEHLFDLFVRGSDIEAASAGGLGVGLGRAPAGRSAWRHDRGHERRTAVRQRIPHPLAAGWRGFDE